MAIATYELYIDWAADGFGAADSIDDITDYWLWGQGISLSRGRDRASQLTGRSVAGRLAAVLDNGDDRFSSFNTGSPLTGLVLPGRKVLFRATFATVVYNLWGGFLLTIEPSPQAKGPAIARLSAAGPIAWLNDPKRTVSVPMQTNILTGAAITVVLDEAGWPAADRTLDDGETTMTRWWQGDASPLTGLRKIEDTDAGFLAESGDRKVVFEDRHHRLASPHTVSQATYSDASGAALNYYAIEQIDPWDEIYNRFEASVTIYTVGSLAVLWTLAQTGANSPSIPPGDSAIFWARYPNPDSATDAKSVDAWTTPVATTDVTANSQADGMGSDLTASIGIAVSKFANDMKITLTNNHATLPAYITLLQARGTPVTASDPAKVRSEDATSQAAYGLRTYPNPAEFVPSVAEGQNWADLHKSIYKDPLPGLKVTLYGNLSDAQMVECLTRQISDRVSVVADGDAGLGINEDFFVEAIEHRITGGNHFTTFTLSPAERYSDFWVLGVSLLGQQTRLVY